ncbi:hypothetical protein HDU81_004882 [Chytriomyces hyalinus]|nr:hypothetical protein HDU81_004882 [Chytriomyces hyalinus]
MAFTLLDRPQFLSTFFAQPPALWLIVCAFAVYHSSPSSDFLAGVDYYDRARAELSEQSETVQSFKTMQAAILVSKFAQLLTDHDGMDSFLHNVFLSVPPSVLDVPCDEYENTLGVLLHSVVRTLLDNTRSTSPSLPELDSQASTPVVSFPSTNDYLNVFSADCFSLPSFDQSADANSINFLSDSLPPTSSTIHGGAITIPAPNLPPTKSNISILPSFSEWGLIHAYLNSTDATVQSSPAYSILDRSNFIDNFFDQPPALWWIVCAFATFYSTTNKSTDAALEYFNRAKEIATADHHSEPGTTSSAAAAQVGTLKLVQALLLLSRFAHILNDENLAATFAKSAVDLVVTMDLQVPLDWTLGQVEERKRTLESLLLDSCM